MRVALRLLKQIPPHRWSNDLKAEVRKEVDGRNDGITGFID
jgi:hypothetical protein